MADVVDSIIAELIARDNGYTAKMREVISLNKELHASAAGASAADQAVEQSAQRQISARKKQTDAEKIRRKPPSGSSG